MWLEDDENGRDLVGDFFRLAFSHESMLIEQVESFEPSNDRKQTKLCDDYPIRMHSSLNVPIREELNQRQREEINKLLRYIIDKIGPLMTIELLKELKTKIDYEF